jgi:DNA-directed RNA polymerase subunit RPC12/RpoP
MKTSNVQSLRVCPHCGKTYKAVPALSRADGKTLICPDCGTREAMASIGIGPEEQEKILVSMHRAMR